MDIKDLRMGDILRFTDGGRSTLVIVTELNSVTTRKPIIVWSNSCYMFEDKEKNVEQTYIDSIKQGNYTLIGNLCDINKDLIC